MTSSPLFIIDAEIDGDLLPHAPVRMFQRLCQRRLFDIGRGPGAERAAGSGDDDADQFLAVSRAQRLKQRIVFAIGGQDAGPRLRRALHEEIAGANQAFLVGERDGRAAIHRRERGLQAGRAADGRHHPVRRPRRRLDHRAFAGAAFGAGAGQRVFQLGQTRGIGDGNKSRAEFLRELRQRLHVGIRGQRLDPVAVARGPQQIHGAVADRAGGAEDGHRTHGGCRGFVVTQGNCAHVFTKP